MEIRFNKIVKAIKSDTALGGVDFIIPETGVTGILGDYGSGKSTVLSLIAGYLTPDSGEIFINQKKIKFREVRDAVKWGIGSVDPNLNLYNKFTIRQNLLLNPNYKTKNQAQIESDFTDLCKQLELLFNFDDLLGLYPNHVKLLFEIIRLFAFGFKLIVLDEPFNYFPENEKAKLKVIFDILKQKNIQFIFTTKFEKEIIFASDNCIVLQNGQMIGQVQHPFNELESIYNIKLPVLPLSNYSDINLLSLINFQIYPDSEIINYNLRSGEIVGVYSEFQDLAEDLLLCCAGLHTAEQGELLLNGFDLFGRPLQEYINDGVVFIADDRLAGNLIPDLSLVEHFGLMGEFSEPTFQPPKFEGDAKKHLLNLGIKQSLFAPVKYLSKKDQIKFLFSVLPKSLSLLICINPTSGLDRETKQWVWHEIKLRANSGIGVLIFSSEEEELLQNTHNIWLNKDQKWFEPFASESLLKILDQPLRNSDEDTYEAN